MNKLKTTSFYSNSFSSDKLKPSDTIQFQFVEDMRESTGSITTPTLSGSATHRFNNAGEFTASDSVNANDGVAIIAGDSFVDSILDTTSLQEDEILLMYGNLFLSGNTSANEVVFSYGDNAGSNMVLQHLSSGSLQFTHDDGTTSKSLSFGSSVYGYGAWLPFMIAIYGDTNSFDFMAGLNYEGDVGLMKTAVLSSTDGIAASAKGLCLFGDNRGSSVNKIFGADATQTTKVRRLTFTRLKKYANPAGILREEFNNPIGFNRRLYNATN